MSSKSMSFKAQINNYAKRNRLPAQVVLQNVMFERFLERLSQSKFRDKFVIKGGMLISALVGLDTRTTMDLDATLRQLELTEETVREAVDAVCAVELPDNISFTINSVTPIRKDDVYGGYKVKMNAIFEQIVTPLSIDVSTGDAITPKPVEYEFSGILDDTIRVSLWGYSIETVLAEKVETILYRGVTNTRPRDFYDVYILSQKQHYDLAVFHKALVATAEHRGSWETIKNHAPIIEQIKNSNTLKELWEKYRKTFHYAKDVTFEDTITALKELLKS